MNILELSKKTMSAARFATLTAEENVILLESRLTIYVYLILYIEVCGIIYKNIVKSYGASRKQSEKIQEE